MCNLYSLTKGQQAIRELAGVMRDRTGNLPLMPGILTTRAEIDLWMTAPAEDALELHQQVGRHPPVATIAVRKPMYLRQAVVQPHRDFV